MTTRHHSVIVSRGPRRSAVAGRERASHAEAARKLQSRRWVVPSDIAAAHGVDALHSAGNTGTGQTIVIVDAYGSPTALQDLEQFSSDFGLAAPHLQIYYPCGTPTFSPALQGAHVGWAFETSLDLQWAHAIAPEANLVLVAANPAETAGVQGYPCIFDGEKWAVEHYPGAVISQSFGAAEQAFQAAASAQVANFEKVYEEAVANRVTVISASGDSGTANIDKQFRLFPYPGTLRSRLTATSRQSPP